ncbi:hypothetical protein GLOIN_2v1491126 [Rhizophagus irregularis DAOM 181602=DAOM 197198]|uniref:Uncharacterized protein n=1 Tax=Rhizophagus irregularis (strain DAOM 181602 / DAOM 197198 / MUCL 43194) TaxID=747089 RepID=A0A2P4R058_RHIID|nr:hypothetical protein GLOIN_2v1491126 [Rhizophagus irregularis DAOM 181602=DAOM 197198]POG83290.1 hypothetical protein GLOIN_2v1491126 [Rhizophagus irregularis DAOM 181602=DAOM 197198]|eukprot:XP_025190156.1 hypothetical protein GLOIN_2v1491126 [Rhizophagus irregularis DAOM 181602=DAOM 197198]
MSRDISKKIEQYEKFLHDKLEVDLKQTWDLREKIYEEISDYHLFQVYEAISEILNLEKGEEANK